MSTINSAEYVELKQAIYREYSRSYDEDRQRFVSAESLLRRIRWALESLSPGQRLLDLGCGSGELLLEAHRQTGGETLTHRTGIGREVCVRGHDGLPTKKIPRPEMAALDFIK